MPEEIVPLISSSVAGPLGIRHLPRLWLKILLYAAGRLPEGYRHGAGGFDELFTDSLRIDNAGFVAYIESQKPSYLQLEAWVKEHARNLTPESVAAFNHTILTRVMNAEMASERRERLGIVPIPGITDTAFVHAVSLNDLDDWDQTHRRLTSSVSLSPTG